MPAGKRLWRTDDGDLVEDGHPDAVTLAYGQDDDLSPDDVENVRPAGEDDPDAPDTDGIAVPDDLTTVDQLIEWVEAADDHDEARARAAVVLAAELGKDEDQRRATLVKPLEKLLQAESPLEVPDGDLEARVAWVAEGETPEERTERASAVFAQEKATDASEDDLDALSGLLTEAVHGTPEKPEDKVTAKQTGTPASKKN